MPVNLYSTQDRTSAVVAAGMVLLALLGIGSVFHEPIAALLFPPAPATETVPPSPNGAR